MFNVTLTLPGFAGLILTIGVAADANVVVFERIKEEVRAGKFVRAAISAGYEYARRKDAVGQAELEAAFEQAEEAAADEPAPAPVARLDSADVDVRRAQQKRERRRQRRRAS